MANVAGFFKTILPWIGAAAAGNVPALVSLASDAVSKAIGKPVKSDLDSIAAAVSGATPDQIIALKQAENDFQAKMEAMGFAHVEELEKIAAEDRASARAREINTRDSWTPRLLAGIVVIGWLVVQSFLLHNSVPGDMRDIISRLLGTLDAALMLVLSYYFGSSAAHDSGNKN